MKSQLQIGKFNVDNETASQPRAHALIDALELYRRHVGGNDHLALVVDQRVEGVAEFLLHGFALEELEIVDEKDIDRLEVILEIDDIASAQGVDEMIHEAFGSDEQHPPLGMKSPDVPGYGIEQMGLSEARRGMDEKRVEGYGGARRRVRNAHGGGMGKSIGFAEDELLEGAGGSRGEPRSPGAGRGPAARGAAASLPDGDQVRLPLDEFGGIA